MKNQHKHYNYRCPKCNSREYRAESISTTGGLFSKIFNLQHRKFTAVICEKCTYTELYRIESSKLENVFDFLSN